MLTLPVPQALHGDQLAAELLAAGFGGCSVAVSGDELVIDGVKEADRAAVEQVVSAHVPPPPPPTREEAIDALPDPSVDFAAFKAALKAVPV